MQTFIPANLFIRLFLALFIACNLYTAVNGHPSMILIDRSQGIQAGKPAEAISAPRKRAFDRLDMSPFDFDVSKRYYDEPNDYMFDMRRKKAFDRLEDSGFFGLRRRRRSFDRLDNSFFFNSKRSSAEATWGESDSSAERTKRPFDRLESGPAFGLYAKRAIDLPGTNGRMSIAELVERWPAME